MKKVKIMLMSALVVAAVGGALAFKAQKFGQTLYCGDTQTSCSVLNLDFQTTGADENHKVEGTFCSTTTSIECTFVTRED